MQPTARGCHGAAGPSACCRGPVRPAGGVGTTGALRAAGFDSGPAAVLPGAVSMATCCAFCRGPGGSAGRACARARDSPPPGPAAHCLARPVGPGGVVGALAVQAAVGAPPAAAGFAASGAAACKGPDPAGPSWRPGLSVPQQHPAHGPRLSYGCLRGPWARAAAAHRGSCTHLRICVFSVGLISGLISGPVLLFFLQASLSGA